MACNCISRSGVLVTPVPSHTDECICVPSVVSSLCSNGPEPCSSDSFAYDLSQNLTSDVCADVEWELRSYDADVFPDAAIDANGVLTATVTNGVGGDIYIFIYRVGCTDNSLEVDGEYHLCLKDMCVGVECDEGYTCDPCDGSCVEEDSDLEAV